MGEISDYAASVRRSSEALVSDFIAFLPPLIAAILTLLGGIVLARIVRGLVRKILRGANRALDRLLPTGVFSRARITRRSAAVIAELVYWLLIFLATAMAARIAGFEAVSIWLDAVVAHLPNLVIGGAIIAIGFAIGTLVGDLVANTARATAIGQSALVGRLAQMGIFATSLIIGLGQIGVDVSFLIVIFAVLAGTLGIGFSIAFGLGSGDYVRDLVSARSIRRDLRPGLWVRIEETEGQVLEVSTTRVALESADGRVLIPARQVAAGHVTILNREPEDDVDE